MRSDPRNPVFGAHPARLAILCLVVLVAFGGALRNGFVWDDLPFIVHNPAVAELRNLPTLFVSDDAVGTGERNLYYRPLTTASFAVDRRIWGQDARGYHATNVLLHLAACVALFFAIRRMTADPDAALVAALLFAVHPAHAEPVGFISARADLLCGLLTLCAFLAYLRWAGTRSRLALSLSLLAFALALLSKIVALALPALVALHLALLDPEDRARGRRLLAAYGLVALAFLALRGSVIDMDGFRGTTPVGIRLAHAGPVLVAYVRNALWPAGLKVFYDVPLPAAALTLRAIAAWGLLAATAALALAARRRRPLAVFGAAWFFAGLLPVCGIVVLLYPAAMADRYLYFPLMGAAIALGGTLARPEPAKRPARARLALAGLSAMLVAACAASTMERVPAWGDPVDLWRIAERENPGNLYVLRSLGGALATTGSLDEARAVLARAIALRDDDPKAHLVMARIGLQQGRLDEAERHLNRTMALGPATPGALAYMGMVMGERGFLAKAEGLFLEALRMDPGHLDARLNLARLRQAAAGAALRAKAP
jgi:tetratricopeptide (TPR) repeat protein